MQTIVKVGIGVVSAAVISTGGYFVAISVLNSEDSSIPDVVSKNPRNFTSFNSTSSGANSVGKIYGRYLLDADSNQDWWTDIYNKYFNVTDDLPVGSTKFDKGVISGAFANRNDQSNARLNKACQKAYEDEVFKGDETPQKINLEDSEWKALWKYCSTFDPKFVNVAEQGTTIKSKGSGQLLSAEDEDNKDLWDMKNADFLKLKENDVNDDFFKSLLSNTQQTLKNKCKQAYDMNEPGTNEDLDSTKTKLENVLRFCSLKEITNN